MPRARLLSLSLVLLAACGDGGAKESAGPATTSGGSTGATPTTSTTDAPTSDAMGGGSSMGGSMGGSSTSGGASTTSDTSSASVGTTGVDSTGTTAGTTGGTTGGDAGQYAAFWWSGGLNHLIVRKLEAGRCTTLSLAWPSQSPPAFTIAMPSEWAVQAASINPDQGECLQNWQPPPETVPSTGGSGTVEFVADAMLFCPKTVDVDVVLTFEPGMPDVPVEDALTAVAVPVQGCG